MEAPQADLAVSTERSLIPLTRWVWIVVPFALAMYPLSIGPLVWLRDHECLSPQVVDALGETAYLPLEWAYQHSTFAAGFFDWYTQLWTV
jgi:hypothetical protein